jgi:8-oxo-dGTP pyrophosphatase MutT (NUDIX family)
MRANKIRLLTLGLIRDENRILLSKSYDSVKQQTFYRALGGGVNFGETSADALKRELLEEIQAEITNLKYLGCIENIFTYEGQPGHEVVQLYQCDFVEPKLYQMEQFEVIESDEKGTAFWMNVEDCKAGKLHIVPEAFLDYIT